MFGEWEMHFGTKNHRIQVIDYMWEAVTNMKFNLTSYSLGIQKHFFELSGWCPMPWFPHLDRSPSTQPIPSTPTTPFEYPHLVEGFVLIKLFNTCRSWKESWKQKKTLKKNVDVPPDSMFWPTNPKQIQCFVSLFGETSPNFLKRSCLLVRCFFQNSAEVDGKWRK